MEIERVDGSVELVTKQRARYSEVAMMVLTVALVVMYCMVSRVRNDVNGNVDLLVANDKMINDTFLRNDQALELRIRVLESKVRELEDAVKVQIQALNKQNEVDVALYNQDVVLSQRLEKVEKKGKGWW